MPNIPNAVKASVTPVQAWISAMRPKTWIASISPVLIGTCMAPQISYLYFAQVLCLSLLLQIGCNFANDYLDFIKGADTNERLGPKRAVQQGWISAEKMKKATILVLSCAFVLSIPLIIKVHLATTLIILLAIATAYFYTGGSKPLGYLGLGEVFVFIFFGPVATIGSYLVQIQTFSYEVAIASISPGLLSCSLLIANNLRDADTDKIAKKKTLIVRFGKLFGKIEYSFSLIIALCIPLILIIFFSGPVNLLSVFFLTFATMPLIKLAFNYNHPKELLGLLTGTSIMFMFFTLMFCLSYLHT